MNEVVARYAGSMSLDLRHSSQSSKSMLDGIRMENDHGSSSSKLQLPKLEPREWDRFEFTIKLENIDNLEICKLYLVVRYVVIGWDLAEFWDNNSGKNFYIGFERQTS